MENVILIFGLPKVILIDNSSQFINQVMREIIKILQINHISTHYDGLWCVTGRDEGHSKIR